MNRRMQWTQQEMHDAVVRAVKLLKSSGSPLSNVAVARCAGRYTKASCASVERYVSALSERERIEIGYPDPNTAQTTGTKLSPDLGNRWRSLAFSTGRRR